MHITCNFPGNGNGNGKCALLWLILFKLCFKFVCPTPMLPSVTRMTWHGIEEPQSANIREFTPHKPVSMHVLSLSSIFDNLARIDSKSLVNGARTSKVDENVT